jgi:hypothetical protein
MVIQDSRTPASTSHAPGSAHPLWHTLNRSIWVSLLAVTVLQILVVNDEVLRGFFDTSLSPTQWGAGHSGGNHPCGQIAAWGRPTTGG